jgi:signal transduction histidine kinase/phage shock protein PspC (stress-responsive transcriptional regulator)
MVRTRRLCDDEVTMTTEAPSPAAGPPKAYRSSDERLLGGVAAGLARHLGVETVYVRVAFLVTALLGGFGVALYAGLWLILPIDRHLEQASPGLEAASRQGRRPGRVRRLQDVGPLVAMCAIAVGVAVLAQRLVGGSMLFWPVLVGVVGLAVLWRQADEAQRERWVDSSGRINLVRAVVGSGGLASYARLAAGIALLLFALVLFAVQTSQSGQFDVARDVVVAGVLGVAGLALTVGPWLFRLTGDLSEERAARVRSQERADMAAHLHDSVLQTLALIQKHAGDGRTVATLARAQERDLRSWLYGDQQPGDTSVASALKAAAAEVEDAHGVPVEVVVVGDTTASDRSRALVLAAREAMVNAARHSGADRVDVYAECGAQSTEVFVRDRGRGFDVHAVPEDRLGVRNSIKDRMRRHGGTATLRTAPGEGTEVRLVIGSGRQAAGGPGAPDDPGAPGDPDDPDDPDDMEETA